MAGRCEPTRSNHHHRRRRVGSLADWPGDSSGQREEKARRGLEQIRGRVQQRVTQAQATHTAGSRGPIDKDPRPLLVGDGGEESQDVEWTKNAEAEGRTNSRWTV